MDLDSLPEGILVGIGNPLLDISANVEEELLEKYDLHPNDAIMAEEKHMPLYKLLMDKYQASFIAGGSVQNSMRVVQWILKKPRLCTYMGCVGDDDYGKILYERATRLLVDCWTKASAKDSASDKSLSLAALEHYRNDGVNLKYQVTKEAPTGTCAVLITHTKRSLVANLAAAQKFTQDHLATEECKKSIESAKFFYTSGFFVAVSPESILQLARHANSHGHPFCMNLSAPFVSQFYKEPLEKILGYVDFLFGNEMEAEAFAKSFGFKGTSLEDIAIEMSKLPQINPSRPRTVVITHSANPVVLVENGKVTLIPVVPLKSEEMVDTNGAGDAFSGGFLSQLIQGKSYKTACECGIYAARYIIQHSGCTFTSSSDFKPSN